MPRYSIAQLIDRAQQGQIGYRGLRRLQSAGIDPSGLASSGVDPSNVPDPRTALDTRHEALYIRALQAAQAAKTSGAPLSAGIQRRLAVGAGMRNGVRVHGDLGDANLQALIEDYRKRRPTALSGAGIYNI